MGAQLAAAVARAQLDDCLEHGAEYGWRDGAPMQFAERQQQAAHVGVEHRWVQLFLE